MTTPVDPTTSDPASSLESLISNFDSDDGLSSGNKVEGEGEENTMS